jgi:citrate synthase
MTSINIGLEGVVVGETRVSHVNGEQGELSYRGVDIATLTDWPFAKVAWWVLFGESDDSDTRWQQLEPWLVTQGQLNPAELAILQQLPRDLHPMLMLQSMVPALSLEPQASTTVQNIELPSDNPQAVAGLIIAAKIPSLIANWHQLRTQGSVVSYPDGQSLHGNFLQMFSGEAPSADQIRLLEVTQILQLEHGFNAGTFAGRVVSSTQSPVQSVIAASIGALYGSLHGGADQAALEMAHSIGSVDKVEAYVQDCLQSKTKIMGMGHREYRTVDPRAKVLKPLAQQQCKAGEAKQLVDVLCEVEAVCQQEFAKKDKEIWANVEFYKGAVFYSLGVPSDFFTALFAMARVYGYVAHFLEFQQAPRLIRPKAEYVGA